MRDTDDLEPLEGWLGDIMHSLSPGPRKSLGMKIMRAVRKANAGRIARNEEPDGGKMTPRKPRKSGKKGRIKRKAKMFRRLRYVKRMKISVNADGGELTFANSGVARVAAEHHYGEEAFVGKTREGKTIKARMAERRLLGFNRDDRDGILEKTAEHLSPED